MCKPKQSWLQSEACSWDPALLLAVELRLSCALGEPGTGG